MTADPLWFLAVAGIALLSIIVIPALCMLIPPAVEVGSILALRIRRALQHSEEPKP